MFGIDHVREVMLAAGFALTAVPLLACGRPIFTGVDGGTTASTSSSTTSGTESGSSTESSTSTESESGSTSTDSTETSGFVPEFDFHETLECDPFAQDCPEGEKCVPWGSTGGNWDANKCVPVLGDQKPGEPCHYNGTVEATDDCDATSHCWDVMDVNGEGIGTCAPFCLGTADDPMCPDYPGCGEYSCLISSNSSINLCILTCDPLAQDCGEGLACLWNGEFHCIFTTQDLPIGAECGYFNDCVAGTGCVSADELPDCTGSACCTPFCDPSAIIDPCPEQLPGTACVPFMEELEPECPVGMCLASP